MKQKKSGRRLIALCLVFGLSPIHAFANLVPDRVSASSETGTVLYGRIATFDDRAITLNGNSVRSGATVMPGARIETPEGVGASLQLWPLGRLDIAPGSMVQVSYGEKFIDINLISGCAILSTYAGVAGTVTTPQGTTERIESETRAFVDVCTGGPGAAAPIVGQGAAARAGAGVCIGSLLFPTPEAATFNPLLFAFGLAPILFAGLYAGRGDGRPPVASASGL